MPKPWGVTGLFAEYTGAHQPLDVDWSLERGVRTMPSTHRISGEPVAVDDVPMAAIESSMEVVESPAALDSRARQVVAPTVIAPPHRAAASDPPHRPADFATFWDFAVALNKSEPAALALAGNGATNDIPIDGAELRKLLGMMWFRTMLARLSPQWRERILNVLIETAAVPDHVLKLGRQPMHLHELTYEQAQEIAAKTMLPDWVLTDLDLVITVGRFWGPEAMKRLRFVEAPERHEPSMMETLLDRFRG
jgi:hypothetical protein